MTAERILHAPPAPGDVLRDYIIGHKGITQEGLANAMGVSRLTVSQLVNNRRSVTAETALRLGRVLDSSAEFWLKLQMEFDLHRARLRQADEIAKLPVLRMAD